MFQIRCIVSNIEFDLHFVYEGFITALSNYIQALLLYSVTLVLAIISFPSKKIQVRYS